MTRLSHYALLLCGLILFLWPSLSWTQIEGVTAGATQVIGVFVIILAAIYGLLLDILERLDTLEELNDNR